MKKTVVALIGASHWHVPLYNNGIKQLGLKVCGVHDADITVARALAEDLKSIPFDNVDKLIEAKPDFVFAFETHRQMPYLAKKLIDHQIAFAIEKPVGLNYAQVIELADLARDKGVFCSIRKSVAARSGKRGCISPRPSSRPADPADDPPEPGQNHICVEMKISLSIGAELRRCTL